MAYYNLTNVTSASTIPGMVDGINQLSAGWLGNVLLLVLFIVIFAFQREHDVNSFLMASFITSFLGVLFFFLHWINMVSLFICIVLLIVSLIIKIFGEQ